MRAITIIKKLRYRYAQKYKHSINTDLLHYSNWLQDEYAELVMKQANGADKSESTCNLQSVSAMFKTEEECIDYFIKIMPFAIAPTRPAKTKFINPYTSHNAFLKVAEAIGKSVFNLR